MTKNEALQMCLEYIETDKHERKYVRHAIKAALEQAEPPPEWEAINNIIAEYGLQAIDFVADWKAAQRKPLTDEQANEAAAKALYETWHSQPEYKPWQDGGNSHKQDEARELVRLAAHKLKPPLLEQEPVTCRFCHDKKGCWAWQCYKCGEIDDVQQPAPLPVQRPWVGLTEDEKFELAAAQYGWEDLLAAAEAKLKERNK